MQPKMNPVFLRTTIGNFRYVKFWEFEHLIHDRHFLVGTRLVNIKFRLIDFFSRELGVKPRTGQTL